MSQYNHLQSLFEIEFEKVYHGSRPTPTLYCLGPWTGGFGEYRIDEDDVHGQYLLEKFHEETDEYRTEQKVYESHRYTGC